MKHLCSLSLLLACSLLYSTSLIGQLDPPKLRPDGPLQNPSPDDFDDGNSSEIPGECKYGEVKILDSQYFFIHSKENKDSISIGKIPPLHLAIYTVPKDADPANINELKLIFLSEAYSTFYKSGYTCEEYEKGDEIKDDLTYIYFNTVNIPSDSLSDMLTPCDEGMMSYSASNMPVDIVYAIVFKDVHGNLNLYPLSDYPEYFSCLIPKIEFPYVTEASIISHTGYCCGSANSDMDPPTPLEIGASIQNSLSADKEYTNPKLQNLQSITKNLCYPVPFNDQLNIQGIENSKIEIFNTKGQKIFETRNTAVQINTDNWEQGIYIIRFLQGDQIVIRKIIKQRL